MGINTDIEWCDSTVNCTSGCQGCELWNRALGVRHCYAGQIHEARLAKAFPDRYAPHFEDVRLIPGRMAEAASWSDLRGKPRKRKTWLNGSPRTIFVGDMGDVFSKAVPFEFIRDEVIGIAGSEKGRRHVWMLLTKQAVRAVEFGQWLVEDEGRDWPANVWMGVSVTSTKTKNRAEIMAYHPAATKYLSVEPMLGPVDFTSSVLRNYRLVIVGGESGTGARPCELAWIRSVVRKCQDTYICAFVKQLGSNPHGEWGDDDPPTYTLTRHAGGGIVNTTELSRHKNGRWKLRDGKGGTMEEWPRDLRIRQFPGDPATTTPLALGTPDETPLRPDLPGQGFLEFEG